MDCWSKYCQAHPFIPQPHIWMWTLKKAKWNVSHTYEISSTDPSGKEPIDMFEKWKPLGQKSFKGNGTDLLFVRFQTCQSDFFTTWGASWKVGNSTRCWLCCCFAASLFVFSLLWASCSLCFWCLAVCVTEGMAGPSHWGTSIITSSTSPYKPALHCSARQFHPVSARLAAATSDQWFFFLGLTQCAVSLPSATIIDIYWLVLFCACIFLNETSILTL